MLAQTKEALTNLESMLHQSDASSGVSRDLYVHLNEVFNRILKFHPYDGFDKFEEISSLVKQTAFKPHDP